jgi:phosphonoacetaldehyde hydrolase
MNSQPEHTIRGIVLDWAGTIVDFGSLAPMGAFVELFARHQVEITIAQARVPMGLPKIDHIAALGRMPSIAAQWQALNGRPFNHADAQQLLTEFEPMSAKAALDRSDFIPGFMKAYHRAESPRLELCHHHWLHPKNHDALDGDRPCTGLHTGLGGVLR